MVISPDRSLAVPAQASPSPLAAGAAVSAAHHFTAAGGGDRRPGRGHRLDAAGPRGHESSVSEGLKDDGTFGRAYRYKASQFQYYIFVTWLST